MDKKSVIGMILIAVIIIAWPFYTQMITPESKPFKYDSTFVKIDTLKSYSSQSDTVKKILPIEKGKAKTYESKSEKAVASNLFWSNDSEKTVTIKGSLYTAKISNRSGGAIKEWVLNNYKDGFGNSVNFVDGSNNTNISFNYHNQIINLQDAVFESSISENFVDLNSTGKTTLRYLLRFDQSRSIEKTYTFYNDRYDIDVDVEFKNFGDEIINSEYQLQWLSGLVSTEKDFHGDLTYFKSYSLLGDEKEEFDVTESSSEVSFSGLTKWIASRTKYFVLFIIPQEKDGIGCRLKGEAFTKNGVLSDKEYILSLSMKFESDKKDRFKFYLGPMDFSILNQYNDNLTIIMEWGWAIIRPLTKAILYTFNFLYGIIPNYGWVIIIFALIV